MLCFTTNIVTLMINHYRKEYELWHFKFIHLFFPQIKRNTFSSITKLGHGLEINFLSEVVKTSFVLIIFPKK